MINEENKLKENIQRFLLKVLCGVAQDFSDKISDGSFQTDHAMWREFCGLIEALIKTIDKINSDPELLKFLDKFLPILDRFDTKISVVLRSGLADCLSGHEDTAHLMQQLNVIGDYEAKRGLVYLIAIINDLADDAFLVDESFLALIRDATRWYERKLPTILTIDEDHKVDPLFLGITYENNYELVNGLLREYVVTGRLGELLELIAGQLFLPTARHNLRRALNIICCYEFIRKNSVVNILSYSLPSFAESYVEFAPVLLITNTGFELEEERFSNQEIADAYKLFGDDLSSIDVTKHLSITDSHFVDIWKIKYLFLAIKAYREALIYLVKSDNEEKDEKIEECEIKIIQLCREIKSISKDREIIKLLLDILSELIKRGEDLSIFHLARYDISDKKYPLPSLIMGREYGFYQSNAGVVLRYIDILDGTEKPQRQFCAIDLKREVDLYFLLLKPNVVFPEGFTVLLNEPDVAEEDGVADSRGSYQEFIEPLYKEIIEIDDCFGKEYSAAKFLDLNESISRLYLFYVEDKLEESAYKEVLFSQATGMFLERRKELSTPVSELSYVIARQLVGEFYAESDKQLAKLWNKLEKHPIAKNYIALSQYYFTNALTIESDRAEQLAINLAKWVLHPESPIADIVTDAEKITALSIVAKIYYFAEKKNKGEKHFGYAYELDGRRLESGRSNAIDALFKLALQSHNKEKAKEAWGLLQQSFSDERVFLQGENGDIDESNHAVRLVHLHGRLKEAEVEPAKYCEWLDEMIVVCNFFVNSFDFDNPTEEVFTNLQKLLTLCDRLHKVYNFSQVKRLIWYFLRNFKKFSGYMSEFSILINNAKQFVRNCCVIQDEDGQEESRGGIEKDPELLYGIFYMATKFTSEFNNKLYYQVRTRLLDTLTSPKASARLRQRVVSQLLLMHGKDAALYFKDRDECYVKACQSIVDDIKKAEFPFVLELLFVKKKEKDYFRKLRALIAQIYDDAVDRLEQLLLMAPDTTVNFDESVDLLLRYFSVHPENKSDRNLKMLQDFRSNRFNKRYRNDIVYFLRLNKKRYFSVDKFGFVSVVNGAIHSVIVNKVLVQFMAANNGSVSLVQVDEINCAARNGVCWSRDDLLCLLEVESCRTDRGFSSALSCINNVNTNIGSAYKLSSALSDVKKKDIAELVRKAHTVVNSVNMLRNVPTDFVKVKNCREQAIKLLKEIDKSNLSYLLQHVRIIGDVRNEQIVKCLATIRLQQHIDKTAQKKSLTRVEIDKFFKEQQKDDSATKISAFYCLQQLITKLKKELNRLDNFYDYHSSVTDLLIGNCRFVPLFQHSGLCLHASFQSDFNWAGVISITATVKKPKLRILSSREDILYFYLKSSWCKNEKSLVVPLSKTAFGGLGSNKDVLDKAAIQLAILSGGAKCKPSFSGIKDSNRQFVISAQERFLYVYNIIGNEIKKDYVSDDVDNLLARCGVYNQPGLGGHHL